MSNRLKPIANAALAQVGGGLFSQLFRSGGRVLGTATFRDGRVIDLDAIAEANARVRPW